MNNDMTRLGPGTGPFSIRSANRLFACGYHLDTLGNRRGAERIYRRTIESLETQFQHPATKHKWYEFALCAFQHGRKLLLLGRHVQARAAFRRAVEVLEHEMPNGISETAIALLATTLCWLARSEYICNDQQRSAEQLSRACSMLETLSCVSSSKKMRTQYHLRAKILRRKEKSPHTDSGH